MKRIKMRDDADLTVGEAFNEFITLKQSKNCASKTIHNYEASLKKFQELEGVNNDTIVADLTEQAIIQYKTHLLHAKPPLSPQSINHYLRDIRAFIYYCMSKGYISKYEIELVRSQEEGIKYLSKADMDALLAKPSKAESFATWRSWMIVNWVFATGNRESTICEVRIGDVNFITSQITLRHTKSRKFQTIPLSKTLATYLKEYIRYFRKDSPDSANLFPSVGDTQLTPDGLRLAHVRYCKLRGVSNTSLHGIRHTFAQEWINNKGNLYQLQVMLGHSTPNMTQRYLRACGTRFDDFEDFNPLDKANAPKARKETVIRSYNSNIDTLRKFIVCIPPEGEEGE